MNMDYAVKWSYGKFFKFVFPSILTMICISFYSVVDSFFVAKFVSTNAMASVNIVLPYTNLVWGLAVMLAAGSSAIVGIRLGEKKHEEANRLFSFMAFFMLCVSVILAVICLIFMDDIVRLLGASELLFDDARLYIFVLIITSPILMFKLFFEYYVRLDGKPKVALIMSFMGLALNVILDYVMVESLGWGVMGASIATATSIFISMLIGIYYFTKGSSHLKFTKFKKDFVFIWHSIVNGSSEMLTEMSSGIVTILFNYSIMKYAAEDGVAAMGVIMNIYYFFISIYMGITSGSQPVISYNYGGKNTTKMKEIMRYSILSIGVSSVLVFLCAQIFGHGIISWYVGDSPHVIALADHGLKIFAFCFLFIGVNLFVSNLYTAISHGKVAALISISRTILFVLAALAILPRFIGIDGIWSAIPLSELVTLLMSGYFMIQFLRIHVKAEEQ